MDDETKKRLTALWSEAGCPCLAWLKVLDLRPMTVRFPELNEAGDAFEYKPYWEHPMTEFAMMCAAEQAAGCQLRYVQHGPSGGPKLAGSWQVRPVIYDSEVGWAGPCESRIECALEVIKACREVNS